jgi:hypothetical protein
MAGRANVVNPTTGETGSVSPEQFARARAAGARQMTDDEATALLEQQRHDSDAVEGEIANRVGQVRGFGEAFGLPTDPLTVGVADLFGKGDAARSYLNGLKRWHPYQSGLGELSGQVGGSILGAELTGGEGLARAPSVAGRIAQSAGSAALRGGLENLVIGNTHDVNETQLGNADLAGEKMFAEMPKHFVTGVAAGGVLGAGGAALGEVGAALKRPAAEVLDRQASAAIGREIGGGIEEGAALRARMGTTPRSSSEVADFLSREQAAYRQAAQGESAAAREALEGAHTTAAWEQSARSEAAKLASAKEARAAVEAVESRHAAARRALSDEQTQATEALSKLGAEREAARKQLRSLAGDLDKVKGAELPDPRNIMREATTSFAPPDPSLTPPSPRAVSLFQEWSDTFANRYAKPGSLTFTELQNVIKTLDTMEVRQRVVSGWGSDPEVKRAFDSLRRSARAEFDRASEATAGTISEAKGLHASRLRASIPELDRAVADAEENVARLSGVLKDFERGAVREVQAAEREGFRTIRSQERVSAKEERLLDRQQRAELRGLPKASKTTPVDEQLRALRQPQEGSGLGLLSMGGAAMSLLHGNVAGAAMAAASGVAARTAKAQGNYLAARTMASLAESIAKADGQIARLAGRAVGRYAREGAEKATEPDGPKRPRLTFEKAAQRVREAEGNPLIIEQRVRSVAGPWASQAPGVYGSLLSSAMRAQSFLASKLPPPRTDPYSLTPQLEQDELSDTEKYDFVQYAKAVADPIDVLKDVADGTVTETQVEALQAVYPQLYAQMRTEVLRRVADLSQPLDYEKSVNIGTLLNVDTNEVMTGEFQSMLADMYSAREEGEEISGGSKPRGVNSRLSKSMSSASQQMQMGDV